MNNNINIFYKNHSNIYKVLLFIATTFLIVFLFPKSGRFKYNFEKGKPWQTENLYAPFNFAIKKNKSEIDKEKELLKSQSIAYFNRNEKVKWRAYLQDDILRVQRQPERVGRYQGKTRGYP